MADDEDARLPMIVRKHHLLADSKFEPAPSDIVFHFYLRARSRPNKAGSILTQQTRR